MPDSGTIPDRIHPQISLEIKSQKLKNAVVRRELRSEGYPCSLENGEQRSY
jgi:hypothetical protein